jgi:hypothetical protein
VKGIVWPTGKLFSEVTKADGNRRFFEAHQEHFSSEYLPTITEIISYQRQISRIQNYTMATPWMRANIFEVTGRCITRRLLLRMCTEATAVVFSFDLSTYDQRIPGFEETCHVKESVIYFQNLASSTSFAHAKIILFLHSYQNMKEKLKTSPLEAQFPDYAGGSDGLKAGRFLRSLFLDGIESDRVLVLSLAENDLVWFENAILYLRPKSRDCSFRF